MPLIKVLCGRIGRSTENSVNSATRGQKLKTPNKRCSSKKVFCKRRSMEDYETDTGLFYQKKDYKYQVGQSNKCSCPEEKCLQSVMRRVCTCLTGEAAASNFSVIIFLFIKSSDNQRDSSCVANEDTRTKFA